MRHTRQDPIYKRRERIGIVSPACTMRGPRRAIMALPNTIHRANGIYRNPLLQCRTRPRHHQPWGAPSPPRRGSLGSPGPLLISEYLFSAAQPSAGTRGRCDSTGRPQRGTSTYARRRGASQPTRSPLNAKERRSEECCSARSDPTPLDAHRTSSHRPRASSFARSMSRFSRSSRGVHLADPPS
jgi:hypothetical protein